MKSVLLNLPTFGFIVSTRAALGVGIGLLLSERIPLERRRRIAAALIGVGAATTIPAAMALVRSLRRSGETTSSVWRDERLIGATRFPRRGDEDVA